MGSVTVVLELKLRSSDGLAETADELMGALIDLGAEDPFVFADASVPSLRVELVAHAETQTEAVAGGLQLLSRAVTPTADRRLESLSARTEELVPA